MKTLSNILIFSLLCLGCQTTVQAKAAQKDVTIKPTSWSNKTKTIVWGSTAATLACILVYVAWDTFNNDRPA